MIRAQPPFDVEQPYFTAKIITHGTQVLVVASWLYYTYCIMIFTAGSLCNTINELYMRHVTITQESMLSSDSYMYMFMSNTVTLSVRSLCPLPPSSLFIWLARAAILTIVLMNMILQV